MTFEILGHPFLATALCASLVAAIAGGMMGSYIVVKRIVFLSGSISHAVLGGMGVFLWLKRTYAISWATPILGALIAAIISAVLLSWIHSKYKEREDTLIAALWSTGMAIGVVFIALTPGYNVELTNFLFGNILWATPGDVALLGALDLFLLGGTLLFHKRFLAICFDEEQALLQGIAVQPLYTLLLCMIAISIVLLIQVVGAILVIAILTIPAAIASMFSNRLSLIMLIASAIGCLFSTGGIIASYELNWPPGATISLIAAFFYLLTLLTYPRASRVFLGKQASFKPKS
jgi:zinc transport system permease protein